MDIGEGAFTAGGLNVGGGRRLQNGIPMRCTHVMFRRVPTLFIEMSSAPSPRERKGRETAAGRVIVFCLDL